MKKKVLQYTWYPKDWQGSDVVYQIGPVDRCTYREFIDLAMENGNEIPDRSAIWWKKWNYDSLEQLKDSIQSLVDLGALQMKGVFFTVPSCDKRLERAFRNQSNGKSGGRPPKPRNNPEETETKPKPNPEETQEERPIQYNTIQGKYTSYIDRLCSAFNISEQRNGRSFFAATYFIEALAKDERLDYFSSQLEGYISLREPRYRGSIDKFIGTPEDNYNNGVWCKETYSVAVKDELTPEQKRIKSAYGFAPTIAK